MHAAGPPSTMALKNQSRVGFLTDEYHGRDATFRQKLDMRKIKQKEIDELKATIETLIEAQDLAAEALMQQMEINENQILQNNKNLETLKKNQELEKQRMESKHKKDIRELNQWLEDRDSDRQRNFEEEVESLRNQSEQLQVDAYSQGKNEGYEQGYAQGENEGEHEGYAEGYAKGYAQGKKDGEIDTLHAMNEMSQGSNAQVFDALNKANQQLQEANRELEEQKAKADERVQLLAQALAALHESDLQHFNATMQKLQQITSQLSAPAQSAATAVRTPIVVASVHIV